MALLIKMVQRVAPHIEVYRNEEAGGEWRVGDKRDVENEKAAELLREWPGCFVEVDRVDTKARVMTTSISSAHVERVKRGK